MEDASSFAPYKALIVEDSELMRNLLRDVLNSFEFRKARSVTSAKQALELLSYDEFDVIMTDWLMDGMTGLEFVNTIRGSFEDPQRRTPILMCTAYTDKKRIFAARDAGVDEILAKPITPTRLYDALSHALFRSRTFIDVATYVGPDRRRRQIPISFPERRSQIVID
ncbi:MAG: response regulator [Pseudomonadota bacterium]